MTMPRITRLPLGPFLAVPLVAGLATGLLEGLVLLFRHYVQERTIWAPVDIIWMAPVTYAALSVPLALAAPALRRLWPRVVTLPRVIGVMGFLGGVILMANLFGGRAHWLAQVILATAIGVQLARLASKPGSRAPATFVRALPLLAGITLVLAVAMAGAGALRSRLAGDAGDPPAGVPNVLLIIWDTVRGENLSLLGYERPTTPQLARWADRATVFEQAMSTAPWTLAGHGSAFTGLHTQELGAGWRTPMQTEAPTLAEFLAAQGYRTGGIVANLIATSRETGLARGFSYYDDFPRTLQTVYTSTTLGQRLQRWRPFFRGGMRLYPPRRAAEITDRFLAWSAEGEAGRPWFAFLNYFDAHDPYFPPDDFRTRFQSDNRLLDKYDGAIHLLDAELDRLLSALEAREELENTIVILASDHGELFGEHGLRQHGNSLYIQLLHIPLVMWGPGIPEGMRVETPVSLRSLPATVAELAVPGSGHPFPGGSLATLWRQDRGGDPLLAGAPKGVNTPPHEPVTLGNMSAVRDGELHYILNGDGRGELYDLESDPHEERNLADDAAWAAAGNRLDSLAHALTPPEWHAEPIEGALDEEMP